MDTDLLRIGRYGKAALGHLSDMLYGRGVTASSGLIGVPSPTGVYVTIGAGSIRATGTMNAEFLGGAGGG